MINFKCFFYLIHYRVLFDKRFFFKPTQTWIESDMNILLTTLAFKEQPQRPIKKIIRPQIARLN